VVKILSRSGDSLADTYDVVGSIAGIEQLESREVSLLHEMGATIFSERLSAFLRRANTGVIAQNITWDIVLTDLPAFPSRILGVTVFADNGGRVENAQVSIRDAGSGREIPIFAWEAGNTRATIRLEDNAGGVGLVSILQNNYGTLPAMLVGTPAPQTVRDIAFRGDSTGFGAGDVTVTALIYIAFSQVGGISSRGLPVPSW